MLSLCRFNESNDLIALPALHRHIRDCPTPVETFYIVVLVLEFCSVKNYCCAVYGNMRAVAYSERAIKVCIRQHLFLTFKQLEVSSVSFVFALQVEKRGINYQSCLSSFSLQRTGVPSDIKIHTPVQLPS